MRALRYLRNAIQGRRIAAGWRCHLSSIQSVPRATIESSQPAFIPKTITWDEASRSYERCTGDYQFHQVSIVAHHRFELELILRRKAQAERMHSSLSLPDDCFRTAYIDHNGRYCPLISPAPT